MGRHRAPGTGTPDPDTGFWLRLGAVVTALAVLGAYVLLRDDRGTTTTNPGRQPSSPTTTAATSSPAPAASSPSATPSPTKTTKPPTLAFRVLSPSYITIRIPGGRTLVSRTFRAGEKRSFNNKVLQVVNGRPLGVRFVVNGKPRKPGPGDRPETFTVRRK